MKVEQVSNLREDDSVTFVARIPWNVQGDYSALEEMITWGKEQLGPARFKFSAPGAIGGHREQTFWLMDSKAALMFKLRWVGI